MTIGDILRIIEGRLIVKGMSDLLEIQSVCGSDMMSDALRYAIRGAMLITSLNQPQVIRTAEIADIPAVLVVLGKPISQDMISMAEEKNIALLSTSMSLFTACGKLYEYGLRSCIEQQRKDD